MSSVIEYRHCFLLKSGIIRLILLGNIGPAWTVEGEGEGVREAGGRAPGEHGERDPGVVREVGHQLPHLLQRVALRPGMNGEQIREK